VERMKKIVFTVTNDLTYDQRMQKICRSLDNNGYEVQLIGRIRKVSVALTNEPFKQTRLHCFFTKGKLFYVEYNLRLFLFLLFTHFDGICAIDLDTIVPVYFSGKLKRAKLFYDAHEYFTEVPEVIGRPVVKKIWEQVEKIFLPRFDKVYTVSVSLAQLFEKKYNKNVEVICNAPLFQQPSKKNTESKTLLYQGALNEGRGLESLIEAMKNIDATLLLAGEGDLSNQLRDLVKQSNLSNKIKFLGFVKPEELKTITANATIGINLLENKGLSYYYSLSNKFFDYIHAGVPQVCISFPEYQNINRKYQVAILVEDCAPEKITTAVNQLLTEQNFYLQLQKNCEVCARHLNWQQEEKKLLALYHDLLG
jgi:glycosyltransferase involved in cell wall biosynthesis